MIHSSDETAGRNLEAIPKPALVACFLRLFKFFGWLLLLAAFHIAFIKQRQKLAQLAFEAANGLQLLIG